MTERFKFTVWRDSWYRGLCANDSSLLREDGKRCCVGFYCQALGFDDEATRLCAYFPLADSAKENQTRALGWLVGSRELAADHDTRHGSVYFVNDDNTLSDRAREEYLTKLFAAQGIDVTFVDGAGP